MPKLLVKKEDWVILGYQLFTEQGASAIVIEKMAKKLKCNKSSFYWHFSTKQAFITALVEYWVAKETEQIITQLEQYESPREQLEAFLAIAFDNGPYLEFVFFLKRYARKHPAVQHSIDQVDARRLAFTAGLFEQALGYSKAEASLKASIFYKYLIGYHEMLRNKAVSPHYLQEVKEELQHFLKL